MSLLTKITNIFRKKENGVVTGGFEVLKRLTSSAWNKTKMLEEYEKSLYVFACVGKIAEKVASTELQFFQILNSRGDIKELVNHPALDLIYRVNPFQTKTEFLSITTINLKLAGDAFWYKVKNDRGQVVELWNLRPDCMEILKDPTNFIKGYKLNKFDGTQETFQADEIVHFKHPTPLDEYFGISPVSAAAVRIDTEEFASKYQRDFFLNSARPDAIVKTANYLTEEQRAELRESFEHRHKGMGKNSKIELLELGLEYQQISVNQREMDYIESMKFTRDDILVAFGVPKPIVAITDEVNYANAETAMRIFLSETIKPEISMMVEKINEMLVYPDFGDNFFLDFDDPTPENRTQTLADYDNGIKNGWMLINEVRQKENLEPVDGGWSLYMPMGVSPVGGLKQSKKAFMNDAEKKYKENKDKKENQNKLKIFRGRELLRQKFIIIEALIDSFQTKEVKTKDDKKKCEENKGNLIALIKGEDLRQKYAEMVMKQTDARAEKLKSELNRKAQKQGNELILKLKHHGDLTKNKNGSQRKAVGKGTKQVIKDFYEGQEEVFAEFVFPFIEEYARQAGTEAMAMINPKKNFEITPAIRKVLQKRAKEFGLGVNATTRDKITNAITDGLDEGEGMIEISNRINAVYEEFPTYRSDMIARTESTAANNEGFLESYKQSDVATHKEWIATLDDRTRPEHVELNGEIVKVGSNFSNGLPYPQEPNCRCVLGPAFEN